MEVWFRWFSGFHFGGEESEHRNEVVGDFTHQKSSRQEKQRLESVCFKKLGQGFHVTHPHISDWKAWIAPVKDDGRRVKFLTIDQRTIWESASYPQNVWPQNPGKTLCPTKSSDRQTILEGYSMK